MGTALNTWHEVAPPAVAPLDRYGLFSVAQIRTDTLENGRVDPHWRFGIEFVDQYYSYYAGWAEDGPCPEPASLYSPNVCDLRQFNPLTIYQYNTDPVPGWTLEQHRQHAVERLVADEERELEYFLLTQFDTLAPTTFDYTNYHGWYGLAMAEDTMGWDYAGQFVLHMSRAAAVALSLHLHVEGGILRTITGTPVIVGSGYSNTMPGQYPWTYIYGTGPLILYKGDIVVTPENVLDMSRNEVSILAQRDYAVGWGGVVRRFQISLDQPTPFP